MIFVVLPVKDPKQAKQRLSPRLDAARREALARAMYEVVIEAVWAARGFDDILVITSDPATAQDARHRGALALLEDRQVNHSQSADQATRHARALGAKTALLMPIDVPLVTPAEIEELLAAAPRPGVLIVPSADGTGTNAMVRTPADAIESRFGPGSFEAHLEQARSRRVAIEVARPPGLVFDVDTPADLDQLLARAPDSRCASVLEG